MCFHSKQSTSAQELENRFKAKFESTECYSPQIHKGFQYPKTPVITNNDPEIIQLFNWGLIPNWAKDGRIKENTLNAQIETINEKASFRDSVNNKCLILADGFFEWQWLDEKGKRKQKYLLHLPNDVPFAFAGLWSEWLGKSKDEPVYTYTVLTTEANELMRKIHNTKKRMPIIISNGNETDWLINKGLAMQNDKLILKYKIPEISLRNTRHIATPKNRF
ncbi:MAG: SOS response-associated peptidase [Flavobacteriales bacterium CG_4_9_14_3_um_filter_40_17]|nr:MAG: SOS response-associated peptidase [Flavobacteriales bacterium CG_4_9_14_3_um_filter_40_17]